ncbi:MAG: glycine rich domain-containing protein [Bacteroidota bacterium]
MLRNLPRFLLLLLIIHCSFFIVHSYAQGVAVNVSGNPADASSIFDVSSTAKGVLLSRMTTAQRNAITNPAEGLVIFNTDTKCFNFYKANSWFEWCGNCIAPAIPVASNNTPVCAGDTLKLFASTVPGATYIWSGPNGFTSTAQNPKIPNSGTAAAGTYSVSSTNGSCSSNAATTTATVNAAPSSAYTWLPLTATINSNVTFTPAVTGASYSWTFQSGTPATSSAQNPVVQWTTSGNYSTSLTVTQNGCSSTTSSSITATTCAPVSGSQTFSYTGASQTFTVPSCITQITIECWGAQGYTCGNAGGLGGYASGTLVVTPGQQLYVYVGGQGTVSNGSYIPAGGGWNGGGNGQSNGATSAVGGGGGGSDVRTVYNANPMDGTSLNSRLIVGGGGGSATSNTGAYGGAGGGLSGQDGGQHSSYHYGRGGTQSAGGDYGGTLGQGGNAEGWMTPWNGAGGGGYYGGGISTAHSGGGGGSSYYGGVTGGSTTTGLRSGDGQVKISW